MHLFIFNPWSTHRSDGLHYLVLRFPERLFSGWPTRWILLPYCLQPPSGAAVILPLGFFCFTSSIPNTLAFWRKTWGIRSVLEGSPFSSCCPKFSTGGSEVVERGGPEDQCQEDRHNGLTHITGVSNAVIGGVQVMDDGRGSFLLVEAAGSGTVYGVRGVDDDRVVGSPSTDTAWEGNRWETALINIVPRRGSTYLHDGLPNHRGTA